ncbi:MAG: tetratricopeptide repeat protein [Microscillaceae bacterium]|jgi:signal transduction histidine kinase|nr:tetratricopeptide repeat protein [Microscillaceae bacterium]
MFALVKKIILIICLQGVAATLSLAQTKAIDSLRVALPQVESERKKVDVLNELAFEYIFQTYDSAMHYIQIAERTARRISYREGEAQSLNIQGIVYRLQGNYAKSLENHLQALKFCESQNFTQGIANNYSNIGLVYFDKKDYKHALEYFFKALELKEKISDKRGVAFSLNDIGNVYEQQGKLAEAMRAYQQTIEIRETIQDQHGIASSYNNMGRIYTRQQNYDEALYFLFKAEKSGKRYQDFIVIAETYNSIARVYWHKKDYQEGLHYFQKALEIAQKIQNQQEIRTAYRGLADCYAALQDFALAYQYGQKFSALQDSVFNADNNRRIASLQFGYELEKKEQIIQNQALIRNAFMIGFGIVMVFLIVLIRENRQKKEANQLLATQKHEIEQKNTELQQQTEEIATQRDLLAEQNTQILEADQKLHLANDSLHSLNQQLEILVNDRTAELQQSNHELLLTNQELDLLLYRSAHDFQGPLATFAGLANLGKIEQDSTQQYQLFERIEYTALKMAKMINKLHKVSYLNGKKVDLQTVDFQEILSEATQNLARIIEKYQVKIHFKTHLETEIITDTEFLVIILENIIENSIYFRSENPQISPIIDIELDSRYTFWEIKITDNGMGIPTQQWDKVYNLFFIGSERSRGNGLGLYVVRKALGRLNGKISLQSQPNQYTTFQIRLPQNHLPD